MGAGKKAANSFLIKVGDLVVEVTHKRVKNIRMHVDRDGTIKVSAPSLMPVALIEAFVAAHQGWIDQARAKATSSVYSATIADGGSITVWGDRCTIHVIRTESRSKAAYLEGGNLVVHLSPTKSNAEGLEKAVSAFLASEVKRELAQSAVTRMEAVTGAHAAGWKVRAMTSRWGSCQIAKRIITINSALARYPKHCLDYVVCHELCHLYEPSHNARFHALMDRFYPGWKAVRKELKS